MKENIEGDENKDIIKFTKIIGYRMEWGNPYEMEGNKVYQSYQWDDFMDKVYD